MITIGDVKRRAGEIDSRLVPTKHSPYFIEMRWYENGRYWHSIGVLRSLEQAWDWMNGFGAAKKTLA